MRLVVYLIILLKMCLVITDLPQSVISRGQRIAGIGAMIMMSHVAVSPAGLGWAGLGWAGLGWAAGGKSNKSRY